ncbi:hypothetical protein CIL05_20650 [Virgibacillus profundi]|uniref:Uncharacterized protein n=1 Tax=Virgibacillus profundi TaxID=2024555 RepID=A0A2A2I994_9BACI|nr:tetratricopeptide repeat protein [Virgibacillus profundi]PAV27710.1 hypothetical protein CIL05_20650 [Virgibacillus profundi]PXY51865.1 tetratricopeptide repeat protein [Virgibacillus profundi]
MQHQTDNVILFPKWKTALEEESLHALKEKRYEEALEKLDKLLSYQIDNHEIIIGKLICLMELGRYGEAQNICEELLQFKSKNYYQYVHMYLTILFQTNQYELLMEQVEYEIENDTIPLTVKEQFQQLYNMSEKMKMDVNIERTITYLDDLYQAVDNKKYREQWRIIENLCKMKTRPSEEVVALLTNENVHPVTKTAIFQWLRVMNFSETVPIHKFELNLTVKPTEIVEIKSQGLVKQTLLLINEQEQKNPTLYQMLEVLLFRYAYVRYPIMPPTEDIIQIAAALLSIGEEYLNIHTNRQQKLSEASMRYKEEIKLCESLYLSIIEE